MNPSIALRAYRESDRESVGELFNDPEVVRFVGDGRPVPVDEKPSLFDRILQKYETDPTFFIWAIEESGQYIGHAELKRRTGRMEYELIYMLRRQCWGRGIGSEIVDQLLEQARAREISFVIATVHEMNAASIAILKKHGFTMDEQISAELHAMAFRLELTS